MHPLVWIIGGVAALGGAVAAGNEIGKGARVAIIGGAAFMIWRASK